MQKRSALHEPERSGARESICDWLWETISLLSTDSKI